MPDKSAEEDHSIRKGDRVDVMFENVPWILDAEVIYTPSAPGDTFVLSTAHQEPPGSPSICVMHFSVIRRTWRPTND